MDYISSVKALQTSQDLLDYPLYLTLLQWLIRLLGDVSEQISTSHVRGHHIVGVIVLETLEHFQYVLAPRECDFLQDAKLLKLLMIFVKHSVNDLFFYLLNGDLNA